MGNARIISIQYNLAASKDQNLECLAISSKAVTNIFFHPTNDTDMSIESRHDQSIGRLFLKKRNNPNKRKVNQQKTLVHWLAWCYLVVNYFSSSRNWLIYKLPDLNVVIQLKQCLWPLFACVWTSFMLESVNQVDGAMFLCSQLFCCVIVFCQKSQCQSNWRGKSFYLICDTWLLLSQKLWWPLCVLLLSQSSLVFWEYLPKAEIDDERTGYWWTFRTLVIQSNLDFWNRLETRGGVSLGGFLVVRLKVIDKLPARLRLAGWSLS